MIKEHLSILSLDYKITEQLTAISSGLKANFTRQYNKTHQAITKKAGGPRTKKASDDSDESGAESSDGGDILIDEEELMEIKKAKK